MARQKQEKYKQIRCRTLEICERLQKLEELLYDEMDYVEGSKKGRDNGVFEGEGKIMKDKQVVS